MNKNTKFILSLTIILSASVFLLAPLFVLGQTGDGTVESGDGTVSPSKPTTKSPVVFENPLGENKSIITLLHKLIDEILIPIGGVVAAIMIIYAGFLYVTARGNPTKISQAHQALLWAVIGAAILIGAWVISGAIEGTIKQLKTP